MGLFAFKFQGIYVELFPPSIYWNSVFGVFFILLLTLPMYTVVFNVLPLIVIRRTRMELFRHSILYLGGLGLVLFSLASGYGLYSIPMSLVIAELILAIAFYGSLYEEKKLVVMGDL